MYFGTGRIACAITIFGPNFPLLRNWAYTGFLITLSEAFISNFEAGVLNCSRNPIMISRLVMVCY